VTLSTITDWLSARECIIMINNVHLRIQLYYIIEKNTMKLLYAWDLRNVAWERDCVRVKRIAWDSRPIQTADAIWQCDANFQFSMTFNFNIFQCFSNIRKHLSNFSYLVCLSCKFFISWWFYLFFETENSRHVAESRPVCVGLHAECVRVERSAQLSNHNLPPTWRI
jgi:hypothetical protein